MLYQHFALIVGKISLQSAFCKVLFVMFIVLKCTVCFVQCVHLQCVLFIVQCAVCGPWHTMCSMCDVYCSLYNVQSVGYRVQCAMCVAYRVHTSYIRGIPVCSVPCAAAADARRVFVGTVMGNLTFKCILHISKCR